ncbi:hypothetical protein [Schaalia vaccimaxillae]|uniref:hypothetical protein n=1 Tax=Schaalia vaccimaxillae TaxID=183916 RepID=UPI0003B6AEDF|nr:hypothetical protein [Schaalia vaccimaxillae]
MSDQEFEGNARPDSEDTPGSHTEDGLAVEPEFVFEPIDADMGAEEVSPTQEHSEEADEFEESEGFNEAEGANVSVAAASQSSPDSADIWSSVRDQPLTGEEVDLSGEAVAGTDEEIIGDSSAPLETNQIEPVTIGSHTTTIPVIKPEEDEDDLPPVFADDDPQSNPVTGDFLAHRIDEEDAADVNEDAPALVDPAPPAEDAEPDADAQDAVAAQTALEDDSVDGQVAETSTVDEEPLISNTTQQRRALMTATPPNGEPELETTWKPRRESSSSSSIDSTPRSLDDALFEGATVIAMVPSRTRAHLWSLICSILLVPIAWYLLADAGARMTLADNNAMVTGVANFAAVGELLGGLALAILVVVLALRSSLGAWVMGVITTIAGIPWLVVPGLTATSVLPAMRFLNDFSLLGAFGQNLTHHLQASGYSGRMLVLGVALMCLGAVSHSGRRRGRAEEALRAEVEKVNPTGAFFTARERRRAEKAAGLR